MSKNLKYSEGTDAKYGQYVTSKKSESRAQPPPL